MQTLSISTSPYLKFEYALHAAATKRQYPKRLEVFLDFLKIKGKTIEEKSNILHTLINKNGREWLEELLMLFFKLQGQRVDNGEMSINTITNYYKPIKLFCEMNGILVNWRLISRGIKKGNQVSEDRPPTVQEIKRLMEYPDLRIKAIVSIMISSGIRSGSWDYMKWKDITPVTKNGIVVAAKLNAFNTKTKRYYLTFISSEAYRLVKEWMDFRKANNESITGESWVMRDLWHMKSQRFGNYLGLATLPEKLSSSGIRMLITGAWKVQGVRENLPHGKKRYEFKSLHGFRKFFETECQKVMKSINVSILMSHDTGIVQHYYKPKVDELLEDYLKGVNFLTINEEAKLRKRVTELEQKQDEITLMKLKHQKEIDSIREQMDKKFNNIFSLLQKAPQLAQVKPKILLEKITD